MSFARFAPLGRIGLAVFASALISAPAVAQSWPSKPITIVEGFPAGSGLDIVGRIIQGPLEKALGTTIVFDYSAGAGGNVASEYVAKAAPDGYTILFGTAGTHGINAALYKKLSFDVEADFTPIVSGRRRAERADRQSEDRRRQDASRNSSQFSRRSRASSTTARPATAPRRTSASPSSMSRPASTWSTSPTRAAPRPSRRCSTARPAASSHSCRPSSDSTAPARCACSAMSTSKRVALLPDIPTIGEDGIPGFESVTWYGMFGPKGLDAAIVSKLNAAVQDDPGGQGGRRRSSPASAIPCATKRHEQFTATIKKDRAQWAEVVKKSGATVD